MEKLKQYPKRGGILRTPRKHKKNKITFITETDEIYWGTGIHQDNKKPTGGPDDIITLSFSDIRAVVLIDLQFTYSTVGKTILKQQQSFPPH